MFLVIVQTVQSSQTGSKKQIEFKIFNVKQSKLEVSRYRLCIYRITI